MPQTPNNVPTTIPNPGDSHITINDALLNDPPKRTHSHTLGMRHLQKKQILRKEVIQPHLPVRLPCYDFVPIADPAFDGSLHKGWATGFGRYRLS